jgi:EAL domain-containing protein (putative c-di-GMP-specific phosphodiesterase class I)
MAPQTAEIAVIDWQEALARVIGEPELVRPVFQPLVDLERGVVCGYEMLARFESPIKAPPPAWFEAAERLGLGGRLESILIRGGLAAARLLPPNRFLTINVSPRALVTPEVRDALLSGPSLGGVVVEITEQAAVEDYDSVRSILEAVRVRGGSIAVDDAGAGYASLQHIVALRPQFVKLDRALITDVDRDEAKLAVIEAFGSFANKIDAWIVAEGIERTGELDALLRLGVPLGQGFGLARPQSSMGDIDATVADHIRGRAAARAERDSISALVEQVPLVEIEAHRIELQAIYAADPSVTHVVRVDERRRPVAIVSRDAGPLAPAGPPMTVDWRANPAETARRAMTRDLADRWDPVVCIDARGHYMGIVRVERLVDELASRSINSQE